VNASRPARVKRRASIADAVAQALPHGTAVDGFTHDEVVTLILACPARDRIEPLRLQELRVDQARHALDRGTQRPVRADVRRQAGRAQDLWKRAIAR
jgi:hypothetical protein